VPPPTLSGAAERTGFQASSPAVSVALDQQAGVVRRKPKAVRQHVCSPRLVETLVAQWISPPRRRRIEISRCWPIRRTKSPSHHTIDRRGRPGGALLWPASDLVELTAGSLSPRRARWHRLGDGRCRPASEVPCEVDVVDLACCAGRRPEAPVASFMQRTAPSPEAPPCRLVRRWRRSRSPGVDPGACAPGNVEIFQHQHPPPPPRSRARSRFLVVGAAGGDAGFVVTSTHAPNRVEHARERPSRAPRLATSGEQAVGPSTDAFSLRRCRCSAGAEVSRPSLSRS